MFNINKDFCSKISFTSCRYDALIQVLKYITSQFFDETIRTINKTCQRLAKDLVQTRKFMLTRAEADKLLTVYVRNGMIYSTKVVYEKEREELPVIVYCCISIYNRKFLCIADEDNLNPGFYELNTVDRTWTIVENLKSSLSWDKMACGLYDTILILEGCNEKNQIEVITLANKVDIPSIAMLDSIIPSDASGHCISSEFGTLTTISDCEFVLNGSAIDHSDSGVFWVYKGILDKRKNIVTWSKLPSMHRGKFERAAFRIENMLYVLGGYDNFKLSNWSKSSEVFNILENSLKPGPALPNILANPFTIMSKEQKFALLFGWNPENIVYIVIFDEKKNIFMKIAEFEDSFNMDGEGLVAFPLGNKDCRGCLGRGLRVVMNQKL